MPRKNKHDRVGRPSDHPAVQVWRVEDNHIEFKDAYNTYAEAAKAINGDPSEIRKCAFGLSCSHKGYIFTFADSEYMSDEIEHEKNQRGRDYSSSTSRYVGVYRDSRSGSWRSKVSINGSVISLGSFNTEEEAVYAQREYCLSNGLQWPLGPNKW